MFFFGSLYVFGAWTVRHRRLASFCRAWRQHGRWLSNTFLRSLLSFNSRECRKSTEESTSLIPVEGSKPKAILLERRDWQCTFRSRVRPFQNETKTSLADSSFFCQCNCGIVRTSLSSFCVVPFIVLISFTLFTRTGRGRTHAGFRAIRPSGRAGKVRTCA